MTSNSGALSPLEMQSLTGGSLMLAWQLKDKTVLIVGGGQVASGRIESLLIADANIILLCPETGLHPLTKHFIKGRPDRISYQNRLFAGPEDLAKIDMVLTAIDDVKRSQEICDMCRAAKVPVNVADIPESCDFYFGSQIRDGPLQIMISTNGRGPKMASLIRKKIEDSLTGLEGEAVAKVGELRDQLKERAPGVGGALGRKRMRWMIDVCNAWDVDDLRLLDHEMIRKLLDDGWENNRVPSLEELGGKRRPTSEPSPFKTPGGPILLHAIGFIAGAAFATLVLISRRR